VQQEEDQMTNRNAQDYAGLVAAAKNVLLGNRHAGQSKWENRSFDFACPSNVTYPFQWLWDSCFHAIALTHIDIGLAQQELLCLLQAAQPNGFIPHMILWEREKYLAQIATYNIAMLNDYLTAISQPPVLAQAVERVVTVTSLLPLILENLDQEIVRRLVNDHLHNPAEFWLPYPVPSVAASEPTFDPEAKTGLLWRGSTWVNMNWFLVGGLQQYGYYELAHELAVRT